MTKVAENCPDCRFIETRYFDHKGNLLKVTQSSYAANAVKNCVGHMQSNKYGAWKAVITDTYNGVHYADIRRFVNGDIKIMFENPKLKKQRNPK